MPIYEYNCPKCNNIFEEWTKNHDTDLPQTCPKCGGQAKHIVSNTSFILKGSGWYATDYGTHKATEKTENQDNVSVPENETKQETKLDNKQETKTETKPETSHEAKPQTNNSIDKNSIA